ncbi:HIT family protein [Microbacterium bovistercoris]|uniref:HIT family protein n=1 Tax=Microbacterium bovistercoris TaxID=2293570 RepID=A0A371NRC9_9MICO|nr:HIT family protein [Microbacterium bovistercoris]REJ04680.1 HIT family protein [Microbacterium bovistercoris]
MTDGTCVFCAIVRGQEAASIVYVDETVVAFMDRFPVTRGHLLVVPRAHAVGLEDLDAADGVRVWETGRELARALRRSGIPCDGINLLLCDGEAANQSVFHVHLHVIPRTAGDGWSDLTHHAPERERALLDADAEVIRRALAMDRG